jgi:hypothetical protein
MKENQIQNKIRAACNTGSTRLWRNNIGVAKINGFPVAFGIPGKGGSDLIGFHKITITREMVGRTVAIFTAVECKSPTGKPTLEQQNFIEFILSQGGIAGIARSETDALTLIQNYQIKL